MVNDGPHERSSTDAGLRSERSRMDSELGHHTAAVSDAAACVLATARTRADSVLSKARALEDFDIGADRFVRRERAREDAALAFARSDADATARDESELRRVALASLLAFERELTDHRLESERDQADRALSSRKDFMAMVSHDLRSLLGGIVLSADLLKEVHVLENPLEKVTQHAERILRFSARMTRLVGDLMDMASIEAGTLGLVRTRRNVAGLLRDSADAFVPAAGLGGIALRCVGDEPGFAEIDHERILQVLTNLVGNAIKFTPKGGQITIRIDRVGAEIRFAVTDTGEGIPHAMLEKIFERHFQAHEADRRGLGLGLFIAKSIVEGHGGRIWAESTPGTGSTLYFTVPATN